MQKKSLNKLSKKSILSMAVTLILIPLTFFLTWFVFGKNYYLSSIIMILLAMIPFFISFEGRKPDAREIVLIAVLTALAVASRVAFVAINHFKPMLAIVMIAGLSFGPHAGFIIGAMSGFVSNFMFGQGPWTPWQMFAYGMAGFIAGIFAQKGILDGTKPIPVTIFGGLTIMLIVGPILNTSSVFAMFSIRSLRSIGAVYLAGLPVDAIHALAVMVTLFFFSKPMTEKLNRIKRKYGMMEVE